MSVAIVLLAFVQTENEVDGETLMSDGFDNDTIKDLFPMIKHQVTFKNARKKLQFVDMIMLGTRIDVPFFMDRAKPNLVQETSPLESSTNTMDTVRDTINHVWCKHRTLRSSLVTVIMLHMF